MDRNVILVILVAVLLVLSGVQAVQITSLKSDIQSGNVVPTTIGTSTQPVQQQSEPTMVGGC